MVTVQQLQQQYHNDSNLLSQAYPALSPYDINRIWAGETWRLNEAEGRPPYTPPQYEFYSGGKPAEPSAKAQQTLAEINAGHTSKSTLNAIKRIQDNAKKQASLAKKGDTWTDEKGVKHEVIDVYNTPNAPARNISREPEIIKEIARKMTDNKNYPKSFWNNYPKEDYWQIPRKDTNAIKDLNKQISQQTSPIYFSEPETQTVSQDYAINQYLKSKEIPKITLSEKNWQNMNYDLKVDVRRTKKQEKTEPEFKYGTISTSPYGQSQEEKERHERTMQTYEKLRKQGWGTTYEEAQEISEKGTSPAFARLNTELNETGEYFKSYDSKGNILLIPAMAGIGAGYRIVQTGTGLFEDIMPINEKGLKIPGTQTITGLYELGKNPTILAQDWETYSQNPGFMAGIMATDLYMLGKGAESAGKATPKILAKTGKTIDIIGDFGQKEIKVPSIKEVITHFQNKGIKLSTSQAEKIQNKFKNNAKNGKTIDLKEYKDYYTKEGSETSFEPAKEITTNWKPAKQELLTQNWIEPVEKSSIYTESEILNKPKTRETTIKTKPESEYFKKVRENLENEINREKNYGRKSDLIKFKRYLQNELRKKKMSLPELKMLENKYKPPIEEVYWKAQPTKYLPEPTESTWLRELKDISKEERTAEDIYEELKKKTKKKEIIEGYEKSIRKERKPATIKEFTEENTKRELFKDWEKAKQRKRTSEEKLKEHLKKIEPDYKERLEMQRLKERTWKEYKNEMNKRRNKWEKFLKKEKEQKFQETIPEALKKSMAEKSKYIIGKRQFTKEAFKKYVESMKEREKKAIKPRKETLEKWKKEDAEKESQELNKKIINEKLKNLGKGKGEKTKIIEGYEESLKKQEGKTNESLNDKYTREKVLEELKQKEEKTTENKFPKLSLQEQMDLKLKEITKQAKKPKKPSTWQEMQRLKRSIDWESKTKEQKNGRNETTIQLEKEPVKKTEKTETNLTTKRKPNYQSWKEIQRKERQEFINKKRRNYRTNEEYPYWEEKPTNTGTNWKEIIRQGITEPLTLIERQKSNTQTETMQMQKTRQTDWEALKKSQKEKKKEIETTKSGEIEITKPIEDEITEPITTSITTPITTPITTSIIIPKEIPIEITKEITETKPTWEPTITRQKPPKKPSTTKIEFPEETQTESYTPIILIPNENGQLQAIQINEYYPTSLQAQHRALEITDNTEATAATWQETNKPAKQKYTQKTPNYRKFYKQGKTFYEKRKYWKDKSGEATYGMLKTIMQRRNET